MDNGERQRKHRADLHGLKCLVIWTAMDMCGEISRMGIVNLSLGGKEVIETTATEVLEQMRRGAEILVGVEGGGRLRLRLTETGSSFTRESEQVLSHLVDKTKGWVGRPVPLDLKHPIVAMHLWGKTVLRTIRLQTGNLMVLCKEKRDGGEIFHLLGFFATGGDGIGVSDIEGTGAEDLLVKLIGMFVSE